jgi:hypothetical protein
LDDMVCGERGKEAQEGAKEARGAALALRRQSGRGFYQPRTGAAPFAFWTYANKDAARCFAMGRTPC